MLLLLPLPVPLFRCAQDRKSTCVCVNMCVHLLAKANNQGL